MSRTGMDLIVIKSQAVPFGLLIPRLAPESHISQLLTSTSDRWEACIALEQCTNVVDGLRFVRQERPDLSHVVVSANRELLWTRPLLERLDAWISHSLESPPWVIATSLGLGRSGSGRTCVYATNAPRLWTHHTQAPILDSGLDLYVVNMSSLDDVWSEDIANFPVSFESEVIRRGWSIGISSIYTPDLCCTVSGDLVSRDAQKFIAEAQRTRGAYCEGGRIPTLLGDVAVTEPVPERETLLRDVRSASREWLDHDPIVSILVRTEYQRPFLLGRLLASVTHAALRAGLPVEVVLASKLDPPEITEAPATDLVTVRQVKSQDATHAGRVANLLAALHAAAGHYVWIVDDDDFVSPESLVSLLDNLPLRGDAIFFTDCQVQVERWEQVGDDRGHLLEATPEHRFSALGWRSAFSGVNSMPVCAYVVPAAYMRERLDWFDLRGNLSEDYALLLLLLTGPNLPEVVEVPSVGCFISKRPGSDTVTWVEDRTRWAVDIGEFVSELQMSHRVASPGAWQLRKDIQGQRNEGLAGPYWLEHQLHHSKDARDEASASVAEIGQLRTEILELHAALGVDGSPSLTRYKKRLNSLLSGELR